MLMMPQHNVQVKLKVTSKYKIKLTSNLLQ